MPANDIFILNTKTRMNPSKPEQNEYHGATDFDYVLRTDSGRLVIASSAGDLGLGIGSRPRTIADQSGRTLGYWEVVGKIDWRACTREGEIPTKAVRYYVFK